MSSRKPPSRKPPSRKSAVRLGDLLGPPPLIEGEDPEAYAALHERMFESVAPADVVEEIWTRDIVDLTWEHRRLQRFKRTLLATRAPSGVERLIDRLGHDPQNRVVLGWATAKEGCLRAVSNLLNEWGLPQDAIAAETFAVHLEKFERIEGMVAAVAGRRDKLLREIDRRRDALASRLREAVAIEDAEFVTVGTPPGEWKTGKGTLDVN